MKRLVLAILALAACGQALALFKVIGPDGRVTYTDRPPADSGTRITPIGSNTPAQRAAIGDVTTLPPDLREAAARYPVTFFTGPECRPCDEARRVLQQRGVPFIEKRVENNDDALALERVTGARTIPAATIGAQVLRGWNGEDWQAFLDAANYPRESRLPRGWANPAPVPLAARAPAAAPAAPAPAAEPLPAPASASAPAPVPETPAPAGGIKF